MTQAGNKSPRVSFTASIPINNTINIRPIKPVDVKPIKVYIKNLKEKANAMLELAKCSDYKKFTRIKNSFEEITGGYIYKHVKNAKGQMQTYASEDGKKLNFILDYDPITGKPTRRMNFSIQEKKLLSIIEFNQDTGRPMKRIEFIYDDGPDSLSRVITTNLDTGNIEQEMDFISYYKLLDEVTDYDPVTNKPLRGAMFDSYTFCFNDYDPHTGNLKMVSEFDTDTEKLCNIECYNPKTENIFQEIEYSDKGRLCRVCEHDDKDGSFIQELFYRSDGKTLKYAIINDPQSCNRRSTVFFNKDGTIKKIQRGVVCVEI